MGGRFVGAVGLMVLAGLGAAVGACGVGAFSCQDDAQCDSGVCAAGSCAFADDTCPSGLRYGEHADNGQSGQCVAGGGTTGSIASTTADVGSTDVGDGGASSTGEEPGDGLDDTAAGDSGESGTLEGSSDGEDGASSESTGSEIVDPDLVAWYRCDGQGMGLVTDSSGHGHHGMCTDCPAAGEGKFGGACAFDGNAQSIRVPHDAMFELQEFTLAAWAYPEPIPDGRLYTVAAKPVGTEHRNSYEVGFNHFGENEVALMCYGASTEADCGSGEIVSGAWIHVAMTYDGEMGVLYINGEVAETGPQIMAGIEFDDAPFMIGLDIDDGLDAHPMDGLIDDVRLYSRALSAEEIAAL